MIDGFHYGQKKIGGKKNVKVTYDLRIQFLEFIGLNKMIVTNKYYYQ
jgi:hypothetical protein